MSVAIWQSNHPPHHEADVLIIGGGMAGCTAAYFIAQAGRTPLIVEKADLALGASGRNAGFMISGLDAYYHHALAKYGAAVTREMWQLSRETLAFWREIGASSAGRVTYDQRGSLLLAESEAEAADLEIAARHLREEGLGGEFMPYDPLERGYYAAILQATDGAVHPVELVTELFQRSNATMHVNNEVYRIVQDAPDVVTVYSRLYTYTARHVLIATNGYSPLLDDFFSGRIIPTRAQVLVTEPLPAPVIAYSGYSDYGYMYYRMTFDGRLLLGGARHHYREQEDDTTEDRLNPNVQRKLDEYLARYFPDVTQPVARRWSGIMGFSVDGLPQVGILPGRPRVGYAVGFTGHGLALGAGVVQRAVAKLLHGAPAGAVDAARLA